jgi:hypothetical protein
MAEQLGLNLSFFCKEQVSSEAIPGLYSASDYLGRVVSLEEVKASNGFFCSFRRGHYVKPPIRKDGSENTGWPGRNLCFLIKNDGKYVGAIAGGSPPLDMKPVQDFFQLSADNKLRGYQGRFIFGNVLYRLEKEKIENPDKNLGTIVLRLWRMETQRIHLDRWSDPLAGFVTLIEPSDCRAESQGAMYKADNWKIVGTTKGNARALSGNFGTDAISRKAVSQKLILCRWAKNQKQGAKIIPQQLPPSTLLAPALFDMP